VPRRKALPPPQLQTISVSCAILLLLWDSNSNENAHAALDVSSRFIANRDRVCWNKMSRIEMQIMKIYSFCTAKHFDKSLVNAIHLRNPHLRGALPSHALT
jgi:hypothetical protein